MEEMTKDEAASRIDYLTSEIEILRDECDRQVELLVNMEGELEELQFLYETME